MENEKAVRGSFATGRNKCDKSDDDDGDLFEVVVVRNRISENNEKSSHTKYAGVERNSATLDKFRLVGESMARRSNLTMSGGPYDDDSSSTKLNGKGGYADDPISFSEDSLAEQLGAGSSKTNNDTEMDPEPGCSSGNELTGESDVLPESDIFTDESSEMDSRPSWIRDDALKMAMVAQLVWDEEFGGGDGGGSSTAGNLFPPGPPRGHLF